MLLLLISITLALIQADPNRKILSSTESATDLRESEPKLQQASQPAITMVSRMVMTSLAQSSLSYLPISPSCPTPAISLVKDAHHALLLLKSASSVPVRYYHGSCLIPKRKLRPVVSSFKTSKESSGNNTEVKESGLKWPVLKRWDVPWQWQTVSLTSLACGISFILTGLVETAAIPYLGIRLEELSLDEKAEILFLDQSITTAVVLGVLYGILNNVQFQPLPEDIFRYDLREPFNLQRGWLLWAGIGLAGAILAITLTGVAMSTFNGETPQRETDALVKLLPLIGSSNISTACLIGITGVLAPILEETVFRGFFMVSMTKWVPTPVSVLISAAVFALAHLTPGEFTQLFVLGTALGLSYAQTRNLLTPITIHAFWNSGVILVLTFLQLQGYDIKELLQAT